MANQVGFSPLQIIRSRNFAGLTESNHLSNAYLTEPETVGTALAYAFGFGKDNVLTALTGGLGNVIEINNREYDWGLHGQNDRAIIVVGSDFGGSFPGYANSSFKIKFLEKYFAIGDNLVGDDGLTYVRVMEEPYHDGSAFVYTVQMTTADGTKYCDPKLIAPGARWSKDFTTVEEYSGPAGGTSYSTPFKLKNQLTTLRKQYEVSRSAATDVMIMELYDPEDPKKKTKVWTKLAEWTALAQWHKEIERSMLYSEYNKNASGYVDLKGQNQRPVYTGAGLRQQISPSNVRYYTELSYELLDGLLLDLSYNAEKFGGQTKFVALTGYMGMREFSDAIRNKFTGLGVTITNEGRFLTGSGNEYTFEGDQFITAKFPNGNELTVKHFPPYDDLVRNRELHPKTKKPIESYRFTILNIGMKDGKSNLRKVAKKGSEMVMWHVAGSTDPFAGISKSINTMRSNAIDGYQVHFLSECGLMLQDPTSCAELIFNID